MFMKNLKCVLLIFTVVVLIFSSCAKSSGSQENEQQVSQETQEVSAAESETNDIQQETQVVMNGEMEEEEEGLKAVFLVPGTIDDPINKSVYYGMVNFQEQYGATIQFVEMGEDSEGWDSYFTTALQEDWDVVLTFSNIGSELIYAKAEEYPDDKIIIFQEFGEHIPPNVFKVRYSLQEASFLAGALAALVTSSDMELANDDEVIGFIGGMSFPMINFNYLAAYIEGAKYVNENIKVLVSYTDDFGNQEIGATKAAEQYANGADIIFQAAGGAGYGVLNEALNSNRYAIGVDIDQAMQMEKSNPDVANHILTSVIRDNENAAFWVLEAHANNTLNYGSSNPSLGLEQGGVALSMNSYYDKMPDDIRSQIENIMAKVMSGEITINANMDMSQEDFDTLVQSVSP